MKWPQFMRRAVKSAPTSTKSSDQSQNEITIRSVLAVEGYPTESFRHSPTPKSSILMPKKEAERLEHVGKRQGLKSETTELTSVILGGLKASPRSTRTSNDSPAERVVMKRWKRQ